MWHLTAFRGPGPSIGVLNWLQIANLGLPRGDPTAPARGDATDSFDERTFGLKQPLWFLVTVTFVLVCGAMPARCQLQPGAHHVTPQFGASFGTNELLHSAAMHMVPGKEQPVQIVADISIDPGVFTGFRYEYAMTRRLAVEGEFNFGVAVTAVQLLLIDPDAEGEPQYDITTLDARVFQYFLNLNYFVGSWGVVSPVLTVGIGQHDLDLRQKGEVSLDPIFDRAYVVGLGVMFDAHPRLGIRLDVRDFMYNFEFDNQFADFRSADILDGRDIGLNVATANPRFQNDVVVSLAFQVRPF